MPVVKPRLLIQEVDGAPSGRFGTLKMPNASLTDNGDGSVTYAASGSSAYTRTATKVVAASNAQDTTNADYVCDGTADQSEINTAIGALPAAGGRIVLSDGLFTISAAIVINKSNVVIEGQGDGTKITLANTTNVDVIAVGDGSSSYSHIVLKNVFIDGNMANQTTNGHGVNIKANTTYTKVSSCHIKNTTLTNIFIASTAHDVVIESNYLDTTKVSSARANIEGGGDRIIIEGNTCLGGDYANIAIYNGTVGCNIIGNVCKSTTGIGIEMIVWDGIIANNFILNPGKEAIKNDGNPAQITGNTIEIRNNPTQACISCSSSDSTSVVGNHILVLTGNTAAVTAIRLAADYHMAVGNLIHFETAQAHKGILFASTRSNMNITNNLIINDSSIAGSVGIDVSSGCQQSNISGNNVNAFATGINITGTTNSVINNNFCYGSTTGILATNADGVSISNNYISNGTTALSVVNTAVKKRLLINGNTIGTCINNAFSLQGIAYSSVSNNTFIAIGTGTNNTYDAIILKSTGTAYSIYNVVNGNSISSVSANKHRYGIREDSTNEGPNIVTNNISLNAATANISTQHTSTDVSHNITA